MYKASQLNLDETVRALTNSDLGFILIRKDAPSLFDVLIEKHEFSFHDKLAMTGNGTRITYHLFKLLYSKRGQDAQNRLKTDTKDIMQQRANAIHNIFLRWTAAGHNKEEDIDPLNSKKFIAFLDEIEFISADYMLLLVD